MRSCSKERSSHGASCIVALNIDYYYARHCAGLVVFHMPNSSTSLQGPHVGESDAISCSPLIAGIPGLGLCRIADSLIYYAVKQANEAQLVVIWQSGPWPFGAILSGGRVKGPLGTHRGHTSVNLGCSGRIIEDAWRHD
jgi:hypothetical protein